MKLLKQLNIIIKKLSYFSPIQKVQTKLYISSIILIVFMVFSFYFASQTLSRTLAFKEQSTFELNSFKQINQHIKLILSNFENKIWKTSTDPVISQSFSTNYNETNLSLLSDRYNLINSQLTILFNKNDYLDDVIIIGKNDTFCLYGNNKNITFYCNVDGFYFSDFLKNTDLTQYFSKMVVPFYYTNDTPSTKQNFYEKTIYNLINGKFVCIRTIQNIDHEIDGIIIMTLKREFITDSLSKISQNQSFYICDNNKNILWSNAPQNQKLASLPKDLLLYKSGTFQSIYKKNNYIFTYDSLLPFNFYLVSQSPFEYVITEFKRDMFYPILFGFLCVFYALFVSYFFSKKLCAPINELAGNFTPNELSLPDHVGSDRKIPFKKISLRNSFILYFIVTFIVPTIFYMSTLTYIYYGIYKSKLLVHSFSTIKHVKLNVDYKLSYVDEFIKNLVYDDTVQALQPLQGKNSISSDQKSVLDKLFLNFKVLNSDLLSMNLYSLEGNAPYSSLDMDNFPINNIVSDFNQKIRGSENKLAFLGSFDGIYNSNTSLLFAHNLRSYNTGRDFGFITVSIDQSTLNDMVQKVALGDTGYFFIMDKQGKIFAHDNENLTSSIFNEKNATKTIFNNNQGSYQLTLNKKDYYIIYDTATAFDFKIVGIVPTNEILSKVLPLIRYSLILLFIYTVILFTISYFISSSITKPLIKLKSQMAEVENGNLNVYMSYNGKNEVGVLVNQFNSMVTRLNELITENFQAQLRESELLFLEKEAQLNALQQQINPHFLYNTLDSIKWMAFKKGAMEAYDMAVALGNFFRGSIQRGKDLITLGEEIEHLENYIYIQNIRFQGKFDIVWDIADNVKEYKTVKLVLQPLVENAINHGIENMEYGGLITIKCYESENKIFIEISDNGEGIGKLQLEELITRIKSPNLADGKRSIGLSNVYKRILLYFNSDCSFNIISELGKGTSVVITIPVIL